MILDQRPDFFWQNMCIDFGRRYVGVPQHELHAAQVGASLQQMAREGMS